MDKFEEIRPYYDHEVESKLRELASNKKVINAFLHSRGYHNTFLNSFLGLFLSFYLNRRFKKIKSIHQYQNMYEKIMEKIIKDTSSGFTYNGLENLKENTSYLFISNHRDITLDPAFLNLAIHKNDFSTVNIAVGSNLMDQKWAADLMRLNKSFIIPRSGSSKREIYRSLNLVSEFIFNKVKVENESIWIAQREGRAKDGKDITDPAILKMIHLTKRKELAISDFFNQMKVIPVSISYEFDPNDLNKAIMQSKLIICRPGYSTIMDLSKLGKKVIFIPTPGQTEQEYLANYLAKKGEYKTQSQRNFNIDIALNQAEKFKEIKTTS